MVGDLRACSLQRFIVLAPFEIFLRKMLVQDQ